MSEKLKEKINKVGENISGKIGQVGGTISTKISEFNENRRSKPKDKKPNKKDKKPLTRQEKWKKIGKIFLICLLVFSLLIGLIVGGVALYYSRNLTSVNINNFYVAKSSTNVFDKNEEYVGTLSLNSIRWTDLKDKDGNNLVAQNYLDALIATEDKSFYSHGGVDYMGMIKATASTLFTDNDRGGSSITMQLAKLIYMQDWITNPEGEEGPLKRDKDKIGYKVTQMLYAHRIEKEFSKEQILENYVNNVGFGNGGYGIVNAANYYYGVSPKDLDLNQSAVLAGMSQLPGVYNPYTNPEETLNRRNLVLGRMLAENYITQEQYDTTSALPIDTSLLDQDERPVSNFEKIQGYLDVVYREFLDLMKAENNDFDINNAGMNIYTNLDLSVQSGIYDIINSSDRSLFPDDVIQTGVVLMNPQNGEVLAIGNGRNEHSGFFGTNYAYNYTRQPGSTAKPIVDAGPAIEYLDWSTAHPLEDKQVSYDGGPEINNWDSKFLGWLSLRESLAKSRNTTALQTFKAVSQEKGLDSIYDFVTNLGFKVDKKEFNQAYSLGGWQYGTTPYELAAAYSAFANGGTYHTPHTIDHIKVNEESKYFEKYGAEIKPKVESKRVMKESTAFMISEMLRGDNPEARGYLPKTAIPLSMKTGTTDWGESGQKYGIPVASQRDKWIAGFNPDITLVTWTGYANKDELAGKYIALNTIYEKNVYERITSMIARQITSVKLTGKRLEQPENVEARAASVSGPTINGGGTTHYFIKGSKDAGGITKTTVDAPTDINVAVDTKGQKVNISWSHPQPSDVTAYSILVDGKEIANTAGTSFSLSFNQIIEHSGCKRTYRVEIQAVNATGGKSIVSTPLGAQIDMKSTSFCQTTSKPTQTKPNNGEDKTEPDEEGGETEPDGGEGEPEEQSALRILYKKEDLILNRIGLFLMI